MIGYDEMWFLGDNCMAKSFKDHVENSDYHLFCMAEYEVIGHFNSQLHCNNRNIVSRLVNMFVQAINKLKKFPRYVIIVLDDDLIHDVMQGFGISTMLGEWIHYLAKSFQEIVIQRKKALPLKAFKVDFPMFYWAAAPHHCNFLNGPQRAKFNNCLESVMKLYTNMRVLKMKEIWQYDNHHYIFQGSGAFSSYGLGKYWASIDAAVKYNVDKHEHFLIKDRFNKLTQKLSAANGRSVNEKQPPVVDSNSEESSSQRILRNSTGSGTTNQQQMHPSTKEFSSLNDFNDLLVFCTCIYFTFVGNSEIWSGFVSFVDNNVSMNFVPFFRKHRWNEFSRFTFSIN